MLTILPILAATFALQAQPKADTKEQTVTIRVVDESGKPAPGVPVGGYMWATYQGSDASYGGIKSTDLEPHLVFSGEQDAEARDSDAQGLVTLGQNMLFYRESDVASKPVIAWTKDHTLIGMAEVPRPCPSEPIEVRLVPACHVTVKTTSTELEQLGRKLTWSNVYLTWNKMRPMSSDSRSGDQVFYLPPGEYKLNAYGADANSVYPALTIAPGEKTKTITVDLPASRIAQLVGKPAPELTNIKGWVNGGPVKLADFKGKIVLLDFWGYWCGPCVHSMPELAELHEKYKDKGLVIIAVHDGSATDIADMMAKLERPKKEIWGGKDLPFLIALDSGKVGPGDTAYGSGDTTAAYGITGFPTQVLIDKDGNVVGRSTKDRLEELLGNPVSK
jgi:thiol-disulfide isomerase/thioredoxin